MPFIVRWDGHVQAGSVSDEYVELNDFYATVADILNIPMPADAAEDSYSILPVLEGEALSGPLREAGVNLSGRHGHFVVRQIDAVTGDEWKLIFSSGSGGWTAPQGTGVDPLNPITNYSALQLYNMTDDVGETKNWLADVNRTPAMEAKADGLRVLLKGYMNSGRSTPVPLALLPGDANLDNIVNGTDFLILRNHFGNTDANWADGDFSDDGTVNGTDFLILRNNFGSTQ